MTVYYSPEAIAALNANMQMSPETWHKVMDPMCGKCLIERGMALAANGFVRYARPEEE